jgi:hypothetical protein
MPETPGIAKLSGRLLDGIGLFRTIKKPACGRLLGDWLGSFLVNRASLQNVHPDLASGCGTRRENYLPGRCDRCLREGAMRKCGAQHTQVWRKFPAEGASQSHTPVCLMTGVCDLSSFTGTALPVCACSASTTRTPNPTP